MEKIIETAFEASSREDVTLTSIKVTPDTLYDLMVEDSPAKEFFMSGYWTVEDFKKNRMRIMGIPIRYLP